MEIEYRTKNLEKVCTIASEAKKKYGQKRAEKIHLRIDQMHAAENVEQMIQFRIGNCHLLHHNRQNQYAVDLVQPVRLVFKIKETEIQIVSIIEITDYHR